ncbi:MAG TPA: alpha/beta fold hydrolase [Pyrinomonadaceae bacterium]|jgi:pimeloyl-ACP methyl ester carboxylesterase/DNA-binding CsgD family transcriptional regulator
MKNITRRIRYVQTRDGVRLAWAEAGEGKLLIKAANWMTHLEYDWESPVWRHWMRFFSESFRFVRHDERGCGMTDWQVGDLSFERWVEDLETVVEAAAPDAPFALLGISQGAAVCIAYAARYPERVSHLILYGGYARGAFHRDDPGKESMYRAMIELVRHGWGSDNPTFRQVFTSRFVPGASDEQLDWFNELCAKTTSGEVAAKLLEARAKVDAVSLLGQVRTPTLVLHSRADDVVPLVEGHILAAGIPDAEFVELDSKNHVLLDGEPAWARFCDEVLRFTGVKGAAHAEDPAFAALTAREREVLSLLAEGFGNAQIASRLAISEKTVRNHISNLFDKLGVWTRAQAIVFARDRGFGG